MKNKSKYRKQNAKYILEELEPRQLFSGGIEGLVVSQVESPAGTYLDVETSKEKTSPQLVEVTTASDAEQQTHEIVFVDTGVENYQALVDDLTNNSDTSRNIEVVLLDSDSNGIEQISATLKGQTGLDAVHIIAHGSDGNVQLGNTSLNADTLAENNLNISLWANAFSESGDILIYGCNLAATEVGQSLISQLSELTLADVAASSDLTGHASLGGDWELERVTGSIEATVALSAEAQSQWAHTLAVTEDLTSTGVSSGANITVAHTTSGTDRLMMVGISMNLNVGETVLSVKWNNTDLTYFDTIDDGGSRVELWYMVAPELGAFNVDVAFNGTPDGATVGVTTFTGVDQSTPLGVFSSGQGSSTTGSANITSAAGELAYAIIATDDSVDKALDTGGQNEIFEAYGFQVNGSGITEAGAASVPVSWTWTGADDWVIGGVSIKPAAASSTETFQEGTNGFVGTEDTYVRGAAPGTSYGADTEISVDGSDGGSETQALIRFDNIFGSGPSQIPLGSTINSASLTVEVTNKGGSTSSITLHRVLANWDESSTWNSMSGGLQRDDAEVAIAADATVSNPNVLGSNTITGLAATVQAWSDGATNYGWAMFNDTSNGWDFGSSEFATVSLRPQLIINYPPRSAGRGRRSRYLHRLREQPEPAGILAPG